MLPVRIRALRILRGKTPRVGGVMKEIIEGRSELTQLLSEAPLPGHERNVV